MFFDYFFYLFLYSHSYLKKQIGTTIMRPLLYDPVGQLRFTTVLTHHTVNQNVSI